MTNMRSRIALAASLALALLLIAALAARARLVAAAPPALDPRVAGIDADARFDAGRDAFLAGDLALAEACWRAVPPGHRDRARARRFLGWELYARGLGEPGKGARYVNESLLLDPFDGNAWQDAWRTYAAALGLRAP